VELLMGLILRSHPSTDALVQQNILGAERFKLWVFRCPKLLANEVVSPQADKPTTPTRRSSTSP